MSKQKYERRQAPQTIAWFRDLRVRDLLDLDPPFQRRSVWNQSYKDFFIETVLLEYPCPPIFLYESISPEGIASYAVVDGKQRLTAVFEFADEIFPVGESSALERYQGRYFSGLDEDTKRAFWRYQFLVEFIPTSDEGTLDNIFDRINRNVARLTRQELRRARFSGSFAASAEALSDHMEEEFPPHFPRIAAASKRQMKDVELVAQLLLLIENGPQSFSQDELDDAYSGRDEDWEQQTAVERKFRRILRYIRELLNIEEASLASSRLRNQADFYSLYGAVLALLDERALPPAEPAARALASFVARVSSEDRDRYPFASRYYDAARSASNDLSRRRARIAIVKEILQRARG